MATKFNSKEVMDMIWDNSIERPFKVSRKLQEEIALREIDELFDKPKTKHAVMTTLAEQRVYDSSLNKLARGIDPQEIANSINCCLQLLELNKGLV